MENYKKFSELRAEAREAHAQMETANAMNDDAAFAKAKRSLELAQSKISDFLAAEQARQLNGAGTKDKGAQFREAVQAAIAGGRKDFVIQREITSAPLNEGDLNNMEAASLPLTINELINPLEMETIYDKVGIQVATGVRGTVVWPCLDTLAEVQVAGETVELGDTDLDFSKITAIPQRVGISVKVTNEAVNDAAFNLVGNVTAQIQKSLGRVLNKAVIGNTAIGKLVGPFASGSTALGSVQFAGDMPTYKELLAMKGVVMGKGVQMAGFCYVMNTSTFASLEATPITEGDSRMIVEGGRIAGYPVFVTDSEKLADGCVNAGCFGYAVLNQHGEAHFIVDPYTLAINNEVRFTLNADWSLTTLKAEAFCVGEPA